MKIEANLFSNNHHHHQRSQFEKPTLLTTKFHRAAIDGYVDMLCEASKRDTNLANESDGLTPTLLAAHHGHLEALRILVGRGGDPEKTAVDGLSALHLAAGRNHLNCVSFLVNFGVNMWALDNELRTAKDIAAIEQSKEVLDYLDQIMAKQSALNTKNVQKLKEKAKIATEKRLKQVRKAQLKAIKQVEKDERYLVKLSNNRRLLKAAHSISDIKLVGRPEQNCHHQVSFSPSDRHPIIGGLSANPQPSGSLSVASDSSRLSSSPNITNLINQKLHMDLLSRTRQLKFCTTQHNLCASTSGSTTTDESAYSSSSVSSNFGYLSTSGSTSALSMLTKQLSSTNDDNELHRRPKYSDLVAVTSGDQKLLAGNKLRSRSKKQASNEQQSLKSNSTIGTRLRGIGGVSRKVQLKRLLLVNSQSSGNLSGKAAADVTPNSSSKQDKTQSGGRQLELAAGSSKLCNVQPTIKLKMAGSDARKRQQQQADHQANRVVVSASQTEAANMIKWPPAPSMTRAASEPDFGVALRCITDEHVSECEDEFEQAGEDGHKAPAIVIDKARDAPTDTDERNSITNAKQVPNTDETYPSEQTSKRDEPRHLLLTQCLSQLKLRHQAILKDQQDKICEAQPTANKPPSSGARASKTAQQATLYDTSDELLQHQLSAGEFPLRPSVIKQQQQQNLHVQSSSSSSQRQQQVSSSGKSSTAISVDSIGSATSLAQRNSESSSSSKSSRSASSVSYSSSYTSSLEVAKMSLNPSQITVKKPSLKDFCSNNNDDKQLMSQAENTPDTIACCNNSIETIETFLQASGLTELRQVFEREKIDLEALMLLTEDDLKSLDILLGPRRKLLKAVAVRQTSKQSNRLGPMYVMVDTPL